MFIIYGQPNCRWCELAKTFLDGKYEPYEYRDITQGYLDVYQADFPGRKTVPAIVHYKWEGSELVNINWIGGYEDLVEYFK